MPLDPAEMYRREQARQKVQALKTRVPLERYVAGLARRKEILPGSEPVIIDAVMKPPALNAPRNHLAHLGAPAPERPADLPRGNGHGDLIARCQAYLDGPGACYRNPRHAPDPDELPMVAVARRFGMNKEDAERFYIDNAVALAGRTGSSLAAGVFHRLATVADGKYLGVEPPSARTEPEPVPSPEPAPKPASAGGLLIGGTYFALPVPEAKPEPSTPAERLLANVRAGF